MTKQRFDAYSHCGRSKYEPWESVRATHQAADVVGGLLVQHLGEFDNSYLVESACRLGPMYRVAVMVNPGAASAEEDLRALAREPRIVGVRVMAAPNSRWTDLASAAGRMGMDVIYVCPDGIAPIRAELRMIANSSPRSLHVLAHFGGVRGVHLDASHLDAVCSLADLPNVIAMLSGFSMYWDYPYLGSAEHVAGLVKAYGPDRVIWGSNYPVRLTRREYVRNLALFVTDAWGVGTERVEQILFGNAARIWGDMRRLV